MARHGLLMMVLGSLYPLRDVSWEILDLSFHWRLLSHHQALSSPCKKSWLLISIHWEREVLRGPGALQLSSIRSQRQGVQSLVPVRLSQVTEPCGVVPTTTSRRFCPSLIIELLNSLDIQNLIWLLLPISTTGASETLFPLCRVIHKGWRYVLVGIGLISWLVQDLLGNSCRPRALAIREGCLPLGDHMHFVQWRWHKLNHCRPCKNSNQISYSLQRMWGQLRNLSLTYQVRQPGSFTLHF